MSYTHNGTIYGSLATAQECTAFDWFYLEEGAMVLPITQIAAEISEVIEMQPHWIPGEPDGERIAEIARAVTLSKMAGDLGDWMHWEDYETENVPHVYRDQIEAVTAAMGWKAHESGPDQLAEWILESLESYDPQKHGDAPASRWLYSFALSVAKELDEEEGDDDTGIHCKAVHSGAVIRCEAVDKMDEIAGTVF